MASEPSTVRDLIELWPSAEIFARDLGLKYPSHGRVIKLRNVVPRRHWDAVVLGASRRGYAGITHGLLDRLHERPAPAVSDLPQVVSAHA